MARKITSKEIELYADFLADYTHDPVGFVYSSFPWGEGVLAGETGPDEWQLKKLKSIKEGLRTPYEVLREATASGHGIGKSALVAWLILWLFSTFPNTKGIVTANTDTQLKTKTWSELAKWYNMFVAKDLFILNKTSLTTLDKRYEKTWRVDAIPWSDNNPDAFAGLHNKGLREFFIFDEASGIASVIWETADGALNDAETEKMFFAFGNPLRRSGRFFEIFHKKAYKKQWKTSRVDSREAKTTDKKALQDMIEVYGEDSDIVRVRIKGEFPHTDEMQFIPQSLIEEAQNRYITASMFNFAPVVIGLDPSWTGKDNLVIFLRQGLYSKCLLVLPKNDNDFRIAGVLARLEDEYNADAVFIDQGYGTGIYSAGQEMNRDWTLVNFGAKSTRSEFINMRVQMWYDLKEWLKNGGVIEKSDELAADLAAPECYINLAGKYQLESKEHMEKEKGLPSPDRADALALTFAFPVCKKTHNYYGERKEQKEYDPWVNM